MPPTISSLSKLFLIAVAALTVITLLLGDGALTILCMAAGLVALPLAYGGDVDDIARAVREGRYRD